MATASVQNIDSSALSPGERNALAILAALPVDDLNALKTLMKLGTPGVIGPSTLAAFTKLATSPPLSLDLSDAGVNAFKAAHQLGNTGASAGAIGPQTAGVYYQTVTAAFAGGNGSTSGPGRTTNAAGLRLVMNSEGYAKQVPGSTDVVAYPDPGTGGAPWTIGYGHTGSDVTPTTRITQQRAVELLQSDLRASESAVASAVTVALTDNQFAALVDFVFNVGAGAFGGSTLLRKLNAGDYAGAADEFGKWVFGGGQALPGLVTRRNAERALFLTP
ncbi:MAG TPA: lysozyme [Candidatus Elarobacter sp.]|jgi:GH24 family phage-related lysozyme (muramidase)